MHIEKENKWGAKHFFEDGNKGDRDKFSTFYATHSLQNLSLSLSLAHFTTFSDGSLCEQVGGFCVCVSVLLCCSYILVVGFN